MPISNPRGHRTAAVAAAACLLVLMGGLARPDEVAAQPVTPRPGFELRALYWLAGCWRSEIDEPGSGEQWMAPAGGTMLGTARMLKGGRVVQTEFMLLRETPDGRVVLSTHPPGQPGQSFQATAIDQAAAVFERGGDGFPQRVIYRLLPDGRLAERVEGLRNGELRGVDFPMRRADCTAPPPAVKPGA